jgi:CubicO group peptidase (beta-lactamase class C family)
VTGQRQSASRAGLHGEVQPGYGRVADVFLENFRSRGDAGSACAVYVGGRNVVDVWAGVADARSGRPWDAGTTAVIFSCSKGILAICAYLLAQEGRLDLDAPVVTYWPGFGQQGKEGITVRCLLSHRAGLPALDRDLTLEEVVAWEPVIRAIEAQRPLWEPGTGHLYHAMTYGWLIGEVIRRITGLTPGRYFRQELGDPLGLETWIGIPASARASVAWMEPPLPDEDTDAARVSTRVAAENPVVERSLTLGRAFAFPARDGLVTFNDPRIQGAEIPAANGVSTARSLAALYAQCVSDMDVPRLLRHASIEDATIVQSTGPQLSGMPDDGARWGTGFQLASPPSQPMLGPGSFGHAGAGGQLAFGDADLGVGFAYLSNQMGGYGDERAKQLTLALRAILRA